MERPGIELWPFFAVKQMLSTFSTTQLMEKLIQTLNV